MLRGYIPGQDVPMIHYQLQCLKSHGFDGWFRDSAAFDAQASAGLVACPVCADTHISRALMAPSVAKGHAAPPEPVEKVESVPAKAVVPGPVAMPDHVRAVLQRMRAEVERHCDYVGPDFADEARRIQAGESERRGIYGETTPEQAEALAEEGIEVASIPWLPRADA